MLRQHPQPLEPVFFELVLCSKVHDGDDTVFEIVVAIVGAYFVPLKDMSGAGDSVSGRCCKCRLGHPW